MHIRRHLLGYHYVQSVIHAIILEHIRDVIIYSAHIMVTYIHGVALSSFFPLLPLLLSPFPSLCTSPYLLGALQLWRNCPPSYQVSCRLTPFALPFTQSTRPFQTPGTPIAKRLTTTTLGPLRSHYAEQVDIICFLMVEEKNFSVQYILYFFSSLNG